MSTALAAGKVGTLVPSTGRVFVIAPAGVASTIVQALTSRGHGVVEAVDVAGALQAALEGPPDLLLIDESLVARLPDHLAWPTLLIGDGRSLPEVPKSCLGRLPVAMPAETLEAVLSLAVDLREVRLRCGELEHLFEGVRDGSAMVGRSPAIRRLHGVLRRAADCDATVLLEGQPGTGKSLAARIVHCKSRRGHRQIEVLACDSADVEAMTAALTRGCDTTLLMEDIDRLPVAAQAVLVRHLKERPQNSGDPKQPRIIATTAAHLPEMVARGAFREDLYYRLHVFPVVVPTLRERTDDIGLLATSILERCAAQGSTKAAGFTASALIMLESMPWPGNVGQMEAAIRRAHALAGGGPIDRQHLFGPATGLAPAQDTMSMVPAEIGEDDITEESIRPFEEEEQRLLGRALRATRGNVRRAAQLLGIGRATLYRKIQQYKLRLN